LRAVHEAAPDARRAVYKQWCQELEKRYQQGAYRDPALNFARRRTLAVLGRRSGDPWRWLRPLLPEPSIKTAAAPRSGGGGVPVRLIFVAVMILSALLRTCSTNEPTSSSIPRLPLPQTPYPYQPRNLTPLNQPRNLQLAPPFEQHPHLLPPPEPLPPK
jgi:hypothetical protein